MRALLLLSLVACGEGAELADKARAAVQAQDLSGRVGAELLGKTVWLEAPMFDRDCLTSNHLAFPDDSRNRPATAGRRLTPTYDAQRWFTASTDKGYCVLLGTDATPTVGTPRDVDGVMSVPITYSLGTTSGFGKCLTSESMDVLVRLEGDGVSDSSWLGGACPHPLPLGDDRPGTKSRPTTAAPKAPSRDEVVGLFTALDTALAERDYLAAREQVQCYNLFEADKVGSCAVAEFLALGPAKGGVIGATTWLEYAAPSVDGFTRITADGKDKSLFRVHFTHKRTKKDRSVGVQWVGGKWKVVGVVELKGEGLTSVRFLSDLHDATRRDIFERRMGGEKIDYRGQAPVDEAPPAE